MSLIAEIARRTVYRDDGKLVWTFLDRRKERIGMVAGTLSSSDGYVYIKMMGKRVGAHRVIYFMHHGFVPDEIDHINRIRSDNRIENLRACANHTQNMGNQSHQKNRSSKYKGVCWDRSRKRWAAMIKLDKKTKNLGRFLSEEQAAGAYNQAAIEHFGEFANLNNLDAYQKQEQPK